MWNRAHFVPAFTPCGPSLGVHFLPVRPSVFLSDYTYVIGTCADRTNNLNLRAVIFDRYESIVGFKLNFLLVPQ